MEGLSKKEIEIIAWLEFDKKYFFTSSDISHFVKNKTQRYNIIKNLVKKERIIKLNRSKYYLVPIKAKSGSWAENSFILADEICDGKSYYIGGWNAVYYWKLIDQIPMQVDIYTTKRQGKTKILNTRIVFHRTTENRIKNSVQGSIGNHTFRMLSKDEAKKWMGSKKI